MTPNFQVLIDSDAFVAMFLPDDANFQRASKGFDILEQNKVKPSTTNWVIAETATVLSYKDNQETAKRFLHMVEASHMAILTMNKNIEKEAWRIFKDQTTKKTSFVDCSNMAITAHFHIPQLFSFDTFYNQFDIRRLI